jgi:DnaJ-domain-containing protein 1
LNGNIITDKEKFTYAVKQQEQICHQNTTLKRAIKYVEYIAEQMKGGAE